MVSEKPLLASQSRQRKRSHSLLLNEDPFHIERICIKCRLPLGTWNDGVVGGGALTGIEMALGT